MSRRLALFDLGRTLVDGDPVILWARLLHAEGRIDADRWHRIEEGLSAYHAGRDPEQAAIDITHAFAGVFAGQTADEILAQARSAYATAVASRVYAYAAPLVARMRARGFFAAGITGVTEPLAGLIGEALGVDAVYGTRLEYGPDGRATGRAVWESPTAWKEARLSHLLNDPETDLAGSFAFGDSPADLPILERVGHPVLVNPRAALARKAISWGWPVVREGDPVVGTVEGLLDREPWTGHLRRGALHGLGA
jgi:HAD superfamily phosphoserine phosphatase-like hydrolase